MSVRSQGSDKRSGSVLVGVDLGTSTIKVVAFDLAGRMRTCHTSPTPTRRLATGWAEHDPDELWDVVARLLRGVREGLPSRATVDGIAVTSVGEAGVPLDRHGEAVRPAIAWFDRRAVQQARWWLETVGMERVYRIAGQPLDPHYGVNKLLWIRDNEPAAFAATRHWLSLADLILYRLSGTIATDRSLASRTLLLDQRRGAWSEELLAACGLERGTFPEVLAGGTPAGSLTAGASRQTGLPAGTPVAVGGHDRLCAAFAVRGGGDEPIDSTGSAEAMVWPVATYEPRDPRDAGFISCYSDVDEAGYVFSARVGYAGALVDWLRQVADTQTGADSQGGARERPAIDPGTLADEVPRPLTWSGLLVLPTFGRMVAPYWDLATRPGAIVGLTLSHHRGHLFQALLEGTAFSLRANIEQLERLTARRLSRVRVEGSATRSELWLQLKADITGLPVEAVRLDEATALGAALLAGVGAGAYADHRAASRSVTPSSAVARLPDPRRAALYSRLYTDGYQRLPGFVATLSGLFNDVLDA